MAYDAAAYSRDEHSLVCGMLRGLNVCFCRIYHHVRVQSPCRLPKSGPAILVCNHLSGLDPILIQAVSGRLIRWMMAREYYEQKGLKWLLDLVGTIPVDRSGRDLAATRAALAALDAGYVLGVFPEGMIETARRLLPFQNGIVLLGVKSGAPIHPAYLEGTQRGKLMLKAYGSRNSARLWFGKPFTLNRADLARPNLPQALQRVQEAVEILRQSDLKLLNNQPGPANRRAVGPT
jgi:1-acyl-sn-glycerol-3-phosphate acyltransferase